MAGLLSIFDFLKKKREGVYVSVNRHKHMLFTGTVCFFSVVEFFSLALFQRAIPSLLKEVRAHVATYFLSVSRTNLLPVVCLAFFILKVVPVPCFDNYRICCLG